MNKAELIVAISAQSGLSKTDSKKALEAFVSILCDSFQKGEKVSIVGFGKFYVHESPARRGISLFEKEEIVIPAKKMPKFKAGFELKKLMDK